MKNLNTFLLLLAVVLCSQFKPVMAQIGQAEREFLFAQKLYDDKLYRLASEQLRMFANRFPGHDKADNALWLSGQAYFSVENYNQAFESLKVLELEYPQSDFLPHGRYLMAECQLALNDYEAAGELFRRVPYFHPDSELAPKAYLQAGRAFKLAGDDDNAVSVLVQLIKDYPDSPQRIDAHLDIVQLNLDRGELNEAIGQVEAVFRVYGAQVREPRVYWLRARLFEKLGQGEEAEQLYRKLATEFARTDYGQKASLYLGDLYSSRGDHQRALEQYEAYQKGAGDSQAQYLSSVKIGDAHRALGNFDLAVQNYLKAETLTGRAQSKELNLKLGKALLAKGEAEAAINRLRRVIGGTSKADSLQSEYVEAAFLVLPEALARAGRTQEALDTINGFRNRFPDNSRAAGLYFYRAEIYENILQDYGAAARAYQDFTEAYPNNLRVDEAQFRLAHCYQFLEDYKMAAREYEKYLKRFPGGDEYMTAQRNLRIIEETCSLASSNLNEFARLLGQFENDGRARAMNYEIGRSFLNAKDFDSAISYFQRALRSAANDTNQAQILIELGKAQFLASQKASLPRKISRTLALLDSAAISLQGLDNEEAAYWALRVSLATGDSAKSTIIEKLTTWPQKYPQGSHREFAAWKLAKHHVDLLTTGQTETIENARKALQAYLSQYPEGENIEHAAFGLLLCRQANQQDSLYTSEARDFLSRFSRSTFEPMVLLQRAKIYNRRRDFELAKRDLIKVISEYFYASPAVEARLLLAEIERKSGNLQSALDIYDQAERQLQGAGLNDSSSLYAQILFKKAAVYEALRLPDMASSYYLKYLTLAPASTESAQARLGIARIAEKLGHTVFARNYYESLLSGTADPESKRAASFALGEIFFSDKSYESALSNFQAASGFATDATEKRRADAMVIRSMIRLRQFTAAENAEKTLKKTYDETKKDEGTFLLERAETYKSGKDWDQARKAYDKLKDDYKNTDLGAQGEFGMGAVDLITNHIEDALKTLTAIPEKYPDSEVTPLAYFNLGDFYYKSQQVENAIHAFKRVIEHPKGNEYRESALLYLIQCYRDANLLDAAVASTREFLEAYPNSELTFRKRIDLAQLLMRLKEYDRAISQLNELLPLADSESEAEIQFYIAQSYKEMGDFSRATSEFLKVKYMTRPSKLPWHVTALFESGRCLLRLNEVAQAKMIFQRIVREQGVDSNFGRFAQKQLEELGE